MRAFKPDPVPRGTVERILTLAARSPSGSNIQPWKVRAVAGEKRLALSAAIQQAIDRDGSAAYRRDWNYYPVNWREPFLSRRRKIGWDLYSLAGVAKGDREAGEAQRRRNFDFFDAPVGMIFTLDEDLEIGSWLDLGIFIGAVMIAARGEGLDTCPQAAFADYHAIIREQLGIPANEIVICGMALGHADEAAAVNRLVTERATLNGWATLSGFE